LQGAKCNSSGTRVAQMWQQHKLASGKQLLRNFFFGENRGDAFKGKTFLQLMGD